MRDNLPIFSVIVPTYRRPNALCGCVQALSGLDYPRDGFEIIIVDDGGSIPLQSLLEPITRDISLKVVWQPNAGPAAARNFGASHAKGDMLAFTDDDCAPASNWLQAFASKSAVTESGLLGGRTINALENNPYAGASQLIIDVVYAHYNRDPSAAHFFASNNMAVPANLFHDLKGFDPGFRTSEDRDLCDRWRSKGYPLQYAADAVIFHAHPLTLGSFWGQHAGYGRGAWLYHTARANRGTGGFRVDWKFYEALLRSPLSKGLNRHVFRDFSLLMTAQIANATGCLEQALKERWKRRRSSMAAHRPERR
ncbi:MAG TPA: glycosyltransferase [Nitrospiraceae bacterium]|nr:glycosyltransferase [Nitrospiraceae bacterium]